MSNTGDFIKRIPSSISHPLHDAAAKYDVKDVRRLLELTSGTSSHERDPDNGRTVLHVLLSDEFSGHLFQPEMEECLQLLIEDGRAEINALDSVGESALSLAVLHRFEVAALTLVQNGADTTIKTNSFPGDHSLASAIAATMPQVMLHILDSGIEQNGEKGQSAEVTLDWGKLLQYPSKDEYSGSTSYGKLKRKSNSVPRETSFLYSLLNVPTPLRGQYLKHPLVSAFLHLRISRGRIFTRKWIHLSSYHIPAIIYLIAYLFFVYLFYMNGCGEIYGGNSSPISCTNMTLQFERKTNLTITICTEVEDATTPKPSIPLGSMKHAPGSAYRGNFVTTNECEMNWAITTYAVLLFLVVAVVGLGDIYMIVFRFDLNYLKSWRTWIVRASYCSMGTTMWGPILGDIYKPHGPYAITWIFPIAAWTIFFGWVLLLLQVELVIPEVRIYVEMLATIVKSMVKGTLLFWLLLTGFFEGFRVMYGEEKTIVDYFRMALDINNVAYVEDGRENDVDIDTIAGRFWFQFFSQSYTILFIVMVGVVFVNFLIGVAISDIQELRDNAEIRALSSRLQNIFIINLAIPEYFNVVSKKDVIDGNYTYKYHPSNEQCQNREKFSLEIHQEIIEFLKAKKYPVGHPVLLDENELGPQLSSNL